MPMVRDFPLYLLFILEFSGDPRLEEVGEWVGSVYSNSLQAGQTPFQSPTPSSRDLLKGQCGVVVEMFREQVRSCSRVGPFPPSPYFRSLALDSSQKDGQ